MKRFILSAVYAAAVVSAAHAEDFSGKCTDYSAKGKDACQATAWCNWRADRQISLPDGKPLTVKGSCGFKAHFKQAWAEKTQVAVEPAKAQ